MFCLSIKWVDANQMINTKLIGRQSSNILQATAVVGFNLITIPTSD